MKQKKTKAAKPSGPGTPTKGSLQEAGAGKSGIESREVPHDLSVRGSGDPEDQKDASARGAGGSGPHDILSKRGAGGWDGFNR